MSLAARVMKIKYEADGALTTFALPDVPIVDDSAEVAVYTRDPTATPPTVVLMVEGALNDYTLTGAPDASSFHTNVEFNTAPVDDLQVIIALVQPFTQALNYNANNSAGVRPTQLEQQLDVLTGLTQQLEEQLTRVPKMNITEQSTEAALELPPPGGAEVEIFGWAADGTLNTYTAAELFSTGGSGIPAGGAAKSVLAKLSATDGDADWFDYSYSGYSSRFSGVFSSTDLDDTLQKILAISYTAPTVNFSASSNILREVGDAVTSTTLTAAITVTSDPIDEVRFYLNPSTLLATQTSGGGIPSGGNSTYAWNGSFADDTTFRSEVDDDGTSGGPTTVTDTTTFNFVYPYYVGAGAVSLSAANVALLTKRIINSTSSRNETITAGAGEVFFFAYPASYGALTSILDENSFETIGDWTLRTENITGLDASAVSYRIYEFDNPVTADDYEYTFIR